MFILFGCTNQKRIILKDMEVVLNDPEEETIPVYRCTWNDMIENRPSKDLINTSLKLLEVKDNLYNVLDSVINRTKKCPKYKDVKLRFLFLVYGFNNKLTINIENINLNCFNCT